MGWKERKEVWGDTGQVLKMDNESRKGYAGIHDERGILKGKIEREGGN